LVAIQIFVVHELGSAVWIDISLFWGSVGRIEEACGRACGSRQAQCSPLLGAFA